MDAKFILVTSGGMTIPALNIAIFEDESAKAIEQSEKIVAQLSLAGYFTFWLFDVSVERNHVHIESFSVEQPKPIVKRTKR